MSCCFIPHFVCVNIDIWTVVALDTRKRRHFSRRASLRWSHNDFSFIHLLIPAWGHIVTKKALCGKLFFAKNVVSLNSYFMLNLFLLLSNIFLSRSPIWSHLFAKPIKVSKNHGIPTICFGQWPQDPDFAHKWSITIITTRGFACVTVGCQSSFSLSHVLSRR